VATKATLAKQNLLNLQTMDINGSEPQTLETIIQRVPLNLELIQEKEIIPPVEITLELNYFGHYSNKEITWKARH